MTTRPLVTVVMPAYNVQAYIADAIASVLAQTYRNFELIVVDDGSTDATYALACRAQKDDPHRVRVMTRPNGGQSAARNMAIAASRGTFIALLDADDVWDAEFLEQQMAVFDADSGVDLVTANGRFLGGAHHGQVVRPFPDLRPPVSLTTIISDEQAVFVMTVFRRRVHDLIGGFDESLRTNEDFDYWLRAALAGFRFARHDRPLAWYRRREDSLSVEAIRMISGALRVCRRVRPLFDGRAECECLDRKILYYEAEVAAARARHALATGDTQMAADALSALAACRPSLRNAVIAVLARRAAPILGALYQLRVRTRHVSASR